jgi:hypothetical protein
MAFDIQQSDYGVMIVEIRNELTKSDADKMQAAAGLAIKQWGKIRVLVKLEDFSGWEKHPHWGDVTFMQEDGQNIEKMAIIGAENWRIMVEAFTGKGFRSTAIQYFVPSEYDNAIAWLGEK